ncbi:MAG: hypothetical protein FIB06_06725 [Betaproteobacteria bacterium]|nr:hypothetical protein [Betaproteobacteria bacterium]
MFAIIVAFILLLAGVGVIYLLLKKMSEDGIDIAAPGSCKRGRCEVPVRQALEDAGEAPQQFAEETGQGRRGA